MKRTILSALLAVAAIIWVSPKCEARGAVKVTSPDRKMEMTINPDGKIGYELTRNGEKVLSQDALALTLSDRVLGYDAKAKSVKHSSVRDVIKPAVPLRCSEVKNHYNGVVIDYGTYSVEFRVFDNGVAYRFATRLKGEIEVMNESFDLDLAKPMTVHMQQPYGFRTSNEEPYTHKNITSWYENEAMCSLPALFSDDATDLQIFVCETDLLDYPGMFLRGKGTTGVQSVFPKCPLEQVDEGDRSMSILKNANYIARTRGTRTFPWRYMVITDSKGLLESTLNVALAQQPDFDTSWIRPGQVAWDWWNHKMVWGEDVNFTGGVNTATYKYFIDFASKYGVPYIILDEGWAKTTKHVFETIDAIDLPELIRYGNSKNVKLILWLPWTAVKNNMDLFATYEKWGIAGCKIDFMDRHDQYIVNYYEDVVREAARHHLLVDFHGAYKPSGIEMKYPNLLSYEGVRGLENNEGCHPDNSIYLPFIRNVAGAMDFTPGAVISKQTDNGVHSTWVEPVAFGTRAYQMALYTVFESGIQMLSDSPSRYLQADDFTRFITGVPVTWDETRAISAKVGEYLIVAKRKGDKWYVAGITNSKERERNFSISLDFLPAGKTYKMTSYEDGYNAHTVALDYRKKVSEVTSATKLDIRMVRNGGFAAVIE